MVEKEISDFSFKPGFGYLKIKIRGHGPFIPFFKNGFEPFPLHQTGDQHGNMPLTFERTMRVLDENNLFSRLPAPNFFNAAQAFWNIDVREWRNSRGVFGYSVRRRDLLKADRK